MLKKYTAKLAAAVKGRGKHNYIGDVGEIHTMSEMLKTTDTDIVVKWLDTYNFARGQWYSNSNYRKKCGNPLL